MSNTTEQNTQENIWRKELRSLFYTFAAGFLAGVLPLIHEFVETGSSPESMNVALISGIALAGLRSALKVVGEYLVPRLYQLSKGFTSPTE